MAAADSNDKQNQRSFRVVQRVAKKNKTEQEKADEYGQGAKMQGVSPSSGLTGGSLSDQQPPQNQPEQPGGGPGGGNQKQDDQSQGPGQPGQNGDPSKGAGGNDQSQGPGQPGQNGDPSKGAGGKENQANEQEKQERTKEQAEELKGQKGGGLMNRIQDGYDKKIDKALEAGGKEPEAQKQRSQKRGLDKKKKGDKNKKKKGKKKGLASKAKNAITEQAKKLTGEWLKQSWINLLDSFGLTYLYIAFHFIVAYFVPGISSFFCKFGHEWLKSPGGVGGKSKSGPSTGDTGKSPGLEGAANEMLERAQKKLELVEILGCFLIGAILAAIIGGIIFYFIVLGYIYMHPLETLLAIKGLAWTIIKCFAGKFVFGAGSCPVPE